MAEGIDMTLPLSIDFAVAATDEAAAKSIAEALAKGGYRAEIDFDEGELTTRAKSIRAMRSLGPPGPSM